jgi:hypothetical protein
MSEVVTVASLPTRTIGVVDEDAAYGSWLADALENVPQLVYPLNLREFSIMAKDPTLSAVISSYTLNILRASWAVDGTGCNPKITQQVADDLGLPIVGKDKPGAARVRGVSWSEHLRAALLCLTYGHFGFELQAELVDGTARLTGLWERAPWTVNEIHVDPKTGQFLGVTQDGGGISATSTPQIKADRMVWYTHDRVGANHAGNSLLRAGFGVHLIKREMLRITATAHRRFSMGVPVVEWAAGMPQPTPEQVAQAQQLASASRAGETAGASLPPGASLKLIGLSGGVPNNMEFLRWLDTQLSRFCLMPQIELGQNSNGGSRALGESFIDSWTLALGSIGTSLAEQATRQISAKIVEWNHGLDEPVPAIRVSGIGEQREVTAQSLQMLLSSGALATDPALEAWVRREYRLPERDKDAAPVKAPGVDLVTPTDPPKVPDAEPGDEVGSGVFAKTGRTPRPVAGEQMALFAAAGDPPEPDFAAIQQQWQQARTDLLQQWSATAQPMVDELAAQAQRAADHGDLGALGTLAVSAGVLAAVALVLNRKGTRLAKQAAAGVVTEAAAQRVTITAPGNAGADRVRQTADAIAGIIASGYASGAARAALQHAGADPAAVRAAVESHLTDLSVTDRGFVADNISALLSASQNAGRLSVLQKAKGARFQAREVNDTAECDPCRGVDGTVFESLADAVKAYPVAGFGDCKGGLRCRGGIFPIWS